MEPKRDSREAGTPLPASGFSTPPLSERATSVALGLVLAIVFLSYLDTLWFQFVHDDRFQILDNTWLRSWRYLPRYFTGDVWAFLHPTFPGNLYRPLFLIWLRLQYVAFGLKPWGWHFCTVLAHVGVTALVYYLSVYLLRDRRAALFATLIFGLHPVHVEAVAWISGVTEPLLAILMIASFVCYLHGRMKRHHDRAYLAASIVLYALAMLAKETALVLPMIVFASELIYSGPAGTFQLRAWLRRGLAALAVITPYLALSAVYVGLRLMALRGFQNPRESHPVLNMVFTWPTVLWFYTRHLIWPVGLGPFYDMEYVAHPGVRNVLLPGLAVMLIAAVLAALAARSQKAALATLWLVLPILPVLNLRVFTEGHFAHDRYLYLPSVGFAMLVGMGLCRLEIGRAKLLGQPAIPVALAAVLALVLGTVINEQSAYFANPNTFMMYAYSRSASGEVAKLDLAGILGEQGYLHEAIKIYQDLWQAHPESWAVNYNLGYAYYLAGEVPEADHYLSRAVEINPYRPEAFFYLGLAKLKMGDLNAAAADVERAVTLRPDGLRCHFALGVILRLQGKSSAALAEFQKELDLDPDNATARQQAQEIVAAQTKERH